jgi:hypothetical protein
VRNCDVDTVAKIRSHMGGVGAGGQTRD